VCLSLPARYSPDFNPIEEAFSKFKSAPRYAQARTLETLDEAIAAADALGWFHHSGHDLSEQPL
jgi:hypothetical protein